MPQETEITYILGKGIDKQTNPIVADGLAELTNMEFSQDGCIKNRGSYCETSYSTYLTGVLSVVSTGNSIYYTTISKHLGDRQVNSTDTIQYGDTPEVFIDSTINKSAVNNIVRNADMTRGSSYYYAVYNASVSDNTAPVELRIIRRSYQEISLETDLTARFSIGGTFLNSPRILYVDFYYTSLQILAEGTVPASPDAIYGTTADMNLSTIPNAVVYVNDLETGVYVAWDSCVIPSSTDFLIAYKQDGAPNKAVVKRFTNGNNTPLATIDISAIGASGHDIRQDSFIAVCANATKAYVTFVDTAHGLVVVQLSLAGGTVAYENHAVYDAATFGVADVFVRGFITSCYRSSSSDTALLVGVSVNGGGVGPIHSWFYKIQDGTATLGTVLYSHRKPWNEIIGRPYTINYTPYFSTVTNNDGLRCSTYLWGYGSQLSLAGAFKHDRSYPLPLSVLTGDRCALNGFNCIPFYQQLGRRNFSIVDFMQKVGIIKVQDSASCYAAGGVLRLYRGGTVFDSGFVCHPSLQAVINAGAGSVPAGDTYYRACYEYVDSIGIKHRSQISTTPASASIVVPGGGATLNVEIRIPACFSNNKNGYVIVRLFRRHAAGTTQNYYDTGLTAVVPNYSTPTVTIVDNLTNAAVEANGMLYDTDEYEAYPAPPSVGMAMGGDRLFLLSGDNRREVWASKPINQYIAPEFGSGITVNFPEEIFAIAYYSNKVHAFAKNRVYSFFGDGPNIKGESGYFSAPQLEPSLGGCMNPFSVEVIPQGVFYQSGISGFTSWYDYDRLYNDFLLIGAEPRSIGKSLDSYSSRTSLVNSIANISSKTSIYIACGTISIPSGDDYVLVYNYRLDCWSKFFFLLNKSIGHAYSYNDIWRFMTYSGKEIYPSSSSATASSTATIITPWLNPSGNLFTTFKSWWFSLLFDKSGSTSRRFTVDVYYDGSSVSSGTYYKDITTLDPMFLRFLLGRRCRSVRFKISFPFEYEDISLYAVKLTCGVYGAAHKPIGGASNTI